MSNVTQLFPPDKSVSERLEELIELTESGRVTGVMIVAILDDGNILDGYAGIEDDIFRALAGIEILKNRLLKEHIE